MFQIGEVINHKTYGKCTFTQKCFDLQKDNKDTTTVYLEVNGKIEQIKKSALIAC